MLTALYLTYLVGITQPAFATPSHTLAFVKAAYAQAIHRRCNMPDTVFMAISTTTVEEGMAMPQDLVAELKIGGLVLYIRHAQTEAGYAANLPPIRCRAARKEC